MSYSIKSIPTSGLATLSLLDETKQNDLDHRTTQCAQKLFSSKSDFLPNGSTLYPFSTELNLSSKVIISSVKSNEYDNLYLFFFYCHKVFPSYV